MPNFAIGKRSLTASAITCAAEWRRMWSASGLRSVMISMVSPSATVVFTSTSVAVDLAGERGLGEARADGLGDVEDGRALGDGLGRCRRAG